MTILDYNRLLRDLNGRTPAALLAEIGSSASRSSRRSSRSCPAAAAEFGMFLDGRWYRLRLRNLVGGSHPIERLPIAILARQVIEPLFGIADRRHRQAHRLRRRRPRPARARAAACFGEMAAAFALYPTQMQDLMAIRRAERSCRRNRPVPAEARRRHVEVPLRPRLGRRRTRAGPQETKVRPTSPSTMRVEAAFCRTERELCQQIGTELTQACSRPVCQKWKVDEVSPSPHQPATSAVRSWSRHRTV